MLVAGEPETAARGAPGGARNPRRGATVEEAKHRIERTRPGMEQRLEVEVWKRGRLFTGERDHSNGKGAIPPDEGGVLCEVDKPLDGIES